MAGILPTLPNEDLHRGAITDAPRYRALDWSLTQVGAEPFEIEIDGRDPEPLRVVCDNVQDRCCRATGATMNVATENGPFPTTPPPARWP
jgi:hypothetical protein